MNIRLQSSGYVLLTVFTLSISTPCQAEIYKCVENGKTTFSQYPCSTKSEKYTPTNTQARIPGLKGGSCTMTVAGSDDADARFTPTKHCFTANSVKEVDEGCMQLQGLMLFASGISSETLDSRNTVKRGTDCDPGAFAKCTYQKGSVEHVEYAYPKKDTDIKKMIEERSTYCKERNGIFNKI